MSVCAAAAAALPMLIVPVTIPVGKPVGWASALTPRLPRSVVCGAPSALTTLPTEAPLNAAYVDAAPRSTMPVGAAVAADTLVPRPTTTMHAANHDARWRDDCC